MDPRKPFAILLVVADDEQAGLIDLVRAVDPLAGITCASDHDEVLAAGARGDWDVIIFSETAGNDLLRELVRQGSTSPIVFVALGPSETTVGQALANGAADYFVRGESDALVFERVLRQSVHRGRTLSALRMQERQFRAVFDGALDAMVIADDDGRYVAANPAALAFFGKTMEELRGMSVRELAPRGDGEPDEGWKVMVKEGARSGEIVIALPDGRLRVVDYRATANIQEGRHLSILRDVTDRHLTEETRSRLAVIIESSDDAIISENLQGEVLTWNRGAENLFGYHPREVLNRSMLIVTPEGREPEETDILTRVAAGHLYEAETIRRRKDGTAVEVSLRASPIRDNDGRIVACSTMMRDLTERRRADVIERRSEDQRRQVQKMEAIGRLAGGIAHDFNNLLSVILSYGSMLLEEFGHGDPIRDDLSEICLAGRRAAELTRQLLAFSRQQVLQPIVLDPNTVLLGAEKLLRRLIGEDVALTLLLSPLVGHISADPGQLEQVIMNLAVNARDAMPTGGALTIESANVVLDSEYAALHEGVVPGNYVMVAATDTGFGMDRATVARIFEPFFTTKEQGSGTGLGLATVYGIVQQSGGHIWVYSEPDVGTCFKVYFPRTDRPAATLTAPRPASQDVGGTETILLVEDEEQVRTIVLLMLRRAGYTVLDAQNGGEAFLVAESFPGRIDLLLTDVVMPRMSGRKLAERLCAVRTDMKVLYMSGYTEDGIIRHGMLDAGISLLEKPITPESLLRKVRGVLQSEPPEQRP